MNTKRELISIFLLFGIFQIYGQISKLDSLLQKHKLSGFNGNVLYSKEDSIYFTGNYGITDIQTKHPLNDSTLFELASCSKQFTALAIVQLIEKKKLAYSTPIDRIIPNFPYTGVTIEHLLRHQSGLPDYMELLMKRRNWNRKKIATNKDALKKFSEKKPKIDFIAGTGYDYSNTGYLILASIIEAVTGKSFSDYLKENIFTPAGMTRSRVYRRRYQPKQIENIAQGFVYNKKKKVNIDVDEDKNQKYIYWLDGIVGDGMVNSTLLDLEKWKQALRYNKLISEVSKEKMFTPDSLSYDYGFGFEIKETESEKRVYHTGNWAGYYSITYYLPNTNEYIVILNNNEYAGLGKLLKEILEIRN